MNSLIKTVGLLFSGGPAPAANSVISSAVLSFLNAKVEVIGFMEGLKYLVTDPELPLQEGKHYHRLTYSDVTEIRNDPVILLKTSRTNPGKGIECLADMHDNEKTKPFGAIFRHLDDLKIDALVTIGGDDTLRTANLLYLYQQSHQSGRNVAIVHLPKTIDNDYNGIDWTFGFFSAADFAAQEVRNINADIKSSDGWFILELMGRQSGWLTYAAGIAGEATKMISVEDLTPGVHLDSENNLKIEVLADEIIDLIEERQRHGKPYGIVCVAEGLAYSISKSPENLDAFGPRLLGDEQVAAILAHAIKTRYKEKHNASIRIRAKQIGFETRCTPPSAFDVLLGCQLGLGAKQALLNDARNGVMVSVEDQLQIKYVPFNQLVDPTTLRTKVRFIPKTSDFYKLARALEFKPWLR